jgi:DNA-binding PadR family transcriptional regulator
MTERQRARLKHEYFLLGLLSQQPGHGYDLHKRIQNSPGLSAVWTVKPGRIYALLDRLEKSGLITATQVESRHAPSRKVYQLTEAGRQDFLVWIRQPVRNGRSMRLMFPARLHFALQSGRQTALNLVEAQRLECRQWLARQHARLETSPDLIFRQTVLFRIGQIEAMLAWLDDCRASIAALSAAAQSGNDNPLSQSDPRRNT